MILNHNKFILKQEEFSQTPSKTTSVKTYNWLRNNMITHDT